MASPASRDYPGLIQQPSLVISDVAPSPRLAAAARAHLARFEADPPAGFSLHGLSVEEAARAEAGCFLHHVHAIDGALPGYLASLGTTAEAHALDMLAPGLTIDESVAAGHFGAAEGRYLQGRATREDLRELGYPAEEIEAILAEQSEDERASACASST